MTQIFTNTIYKYYDSLWMVYPIDRDKKIIILVPDTLFYITHNLRVSNCLTNK